MDELIIKIAEGQKRLAESVDEMTMAVLALIGLLESDRLTVKYGGTDGLTDSLDEILKEKKGLS